LAELYRACPMAGVIDLKTVTTNPALVDELLPPYRETVHRVPNPPLEPAIPRIRYPISVRAEAPNVSSTNEALRLAEAPHATAGDKVAAASNSGDWLIDPKEWLTSGGEPKQDVAPQASESPKPEPTPEPKATPSEPPKADELTLPAAPTTPAPAVE